MLYTAIPMQDVTNSVRLPSSFFVRKILLWINSSCTDFIYGNGSLSRHT